MLPGALTHPACDTLLTSIMCLGEQILGVCAVSLWEERVNSLTWFGSKIWEMPQL